jgi:hypothetical protein
MAALDAAIQEKKARRRSAIVDCRVKPGHDNCSSSKSKLAY